MAMVDETVIGWAHHTLLQTKKLQDTAKLTISVCKEYRSAGVGSNLLHRGIDWTEANGYRKVYNSLPATNETAIAFLKVHDWYTEAIWEDYYTVHDQLGAEAMMAYTF